MKRKPSRRAAENAPYEIGYCKPPKHTRFKPGQCGYPSGRPRGRRNLRTAVRDALKEKITMREGDRTRNVSKMDAIIQVTLNKALKGDAKAFVAFIQLARWVGLMDEEAELYAARLTATQHASAFALFQCGNIDALSLRRKPMRKTACKIAVVGLLAWLLGISSSSAVSPPQRPNPHVGVVIPVVVCEDEKTARCQKRPKCKADMVAVCMCSVHASRTGELVCCRWKCSEGPF